MAQRLILKKLSGKSVIMNLNDFIESSPDQLRIQISKAAKREEKLMQELESVKAQVKQGVDQDCPDLNPTSMCKPFTHNTFCTW